ncbi:hypothetical protein NPIL_115381 [Nephila pilipes]|uniref:Uncharacterized protein n=1 Tax=Nephila pilipes TaxID=299642 RepID=A0A8X6TXD3_NEPPI|nr:hypothetical protein NPIL_115381 [Nephila pilipes]
MNFETGSHSILSITNPKNEKKEVFLFAYKKNVTEETILRRALEFLLRETEREIWLASLIVPLTESEDKMSNIYFSIELRETIECGPMYYLKEHEGCLWNLGCMREEFLFFESEYSNPTVYDVRRRFLCTCPRKTFSKKLSVMANVVASGTERIAMTEHEPKLVMPEASINPFLKPFNESTYAEVHYGLRAEAVDLLGGGGESSRANEDMENALPVWRKILNRLCCFKGIPYAPMTNDQKMDDTECDK